MKITPIKTRIFKEKESLFDFLTKHVPKISNGDIIVCTSKIVALAEGRVAEISQEEKVIKDESKVAIKTPWGFVTENSDGWGINAGIDESNAGNKIILMPKNPHKTAYILLDQIKKYYKVKKLGIIITDTRSIPLRKGTIGRAVAFAGFEPIKSYVGKKDIFGRKSRVTESNLADALAGGAVLVMGEGNEQKPIAIIEDAPVVFERNKKPSKSNILSFPPENDIFAYIFDYVRKKKNTRD